MHRIATTYSTWFVPILFAAVLGLSACDSGDPVDGPEPAEVAGTYTFDQLAFEPNAAGVADVNLLDTLVTSNTELRLFGDGEFSLEYQFRNDEQSLATGTFSVRTDRITLTGDAQDEEELERLLLGQQITLNRSVTSDTLAAQIEKTVNLEQLNPEAYESLDDVQGTLLVRLILAQAGTE